MYMFTIAGGGMWDGSIKTNKPLKYYPGVPTFNVVVYLLVEGEGSATSSTNTEVVPEPKAKPVDDNVGPPTPPSSSTSPWQPTTILASQCPTGSKSILNNSRPLRHEPVQEVGEIEQINEKSATVPKKTGSRLVFLQNLAMPGTYVHFSIDGFIHYSSYICRE